MRALCPVKLNYYPCASREGILEGGGLTLPPPLTVFISVLDGRPLYCVGRKNIAYDKNHPHADTKQLKVKTSKTGGGDILARLKSPTGLSELLIARQ
jgi:hypothetical protein